MLAQSVYHHFIDTANKSFPHEGKLNVKVSRVVVAGWVWEAAEGWEGQGKCHFLSFRKEKYGVSHKHSSIPKPAILARNLFCQASLQYRLE